MNFVTFSLNLSREINGKDLVGTFTWLPMWDVRNAYQICVAERSGERYVGAPRHTSEDNIKISPDMAFGMTIITLNKIIENNSRRKRAEWQFAATQWMWRLTYQEAPWIPVRLRFARLQFSIRYTCSCWLRAASACDCHIPTQWSAFVCLQFEWLIFGALRSYYAIAFGGFI